MRVTCTACPLQAEGALPDGREWYYRARHGVWRLDVPYGTTLADGVGDDTWGEMCRHLAEHLPELGSAWEIDQALEVIL